MAGVGSGFSQDLPMRSRRIPAKHSPVLLLHHHVVD